MVADPAMAADQALEEDPGSEEEAHSDRERCIKQHAQSAETSVTFRSSRLKEGQYTAGTASGKESSTTDKLLHIPQEVIL